MKSKLAIAVVLTCCSVAFSQDNQNDGNRLVTVPARYVSPEGMQHQQSLPVPEQASQWVGVGKEIGEATREGLGAVVDTATKFGSTKVGTFVMVMIAWKIMAKEVLGVILGIPLLLAGVGLWLYVARRLFFGYRVIDKHEGHTKTYTDHPPYEFHTSDARCGAAWCLALSFIAFLIAMLVLIF
jgi:hypothetical protein